MDGSKEQANGYLGEIGHRRLPGLFPGIGAAAAAGAAAGRQLWLRKSGYCPSAAGDAAAGTGDGGAVSNRAADHRAGGAAAAVSDPPHPGGASGPERPCGGPETHHGLCPHRGAERPPVPGRAGTPALRHAGGRRLCRRAAACLHGDAAYRSGAGMPAAVWAVCAACPAPGDRQCIPGQPPQRQILPGPDPPCHGRGAGPGVLPGGGAGPDGGDPLPPPEE